MLIAIFSDRGLAHGNRSRFIFEPIDRKEAQRTDQGDHRRAALRQVILAEQHLLPSSAQRRR